MLKVRGGAGDEEAGGADGDDARPEVVAEALGADDGVDDQVIGVGLHGDVAGGAVDRLGHDGAAGHGHAGGFVQTDRERRPEAGGGLGDDGRARGVARGGTNGGRADREGRGGESGAHRWRLDEGATK